MGSIECKRILQGNLVGKIILKYKGETSREGAVTMEKQFIEGENAEARK